MTLEMFRTLTPWLLGLVAIVQAGMSFFLGYILYKIDRLEAKRQTDQEKNYEKFIAAEAYYMAAGKTDALIGEIFKQLKDINATMNQIVGEFRTKEKHDP